LNWVPLAGLAVFLVAFSFGYGPLPWLISAEMLPPRVKASAASASFGLNWLLVFVVTRTFPALSWELGAGTVFAAFAAVCYAGLAATILYVPETKNKDLHEIQEYFRAKCLCCFKQGPTTT
jgi:SP family facilitated glucose transporter-like MFS transporter 8